MRDYSKVAPQFWIGQTGKRIRKAGVEAQLVALYLLTSPHANMIGLYHLPVAYITADTGMPIEGASKALARLSEAGFCGYDDEAEVVWVFHMARFQIADQLKTGDRQCIGAQNAYDDVPENRFLPEFFDKYVGAFNLTTRRGFEGASKGLSKGLRSQEQEQEQEQKQEQNPSGAPASPTPPASGQSLSLVAGSKGEPEAKQETELQSACRETWKAYAMAFAARYGTDPVRNAKVNAAIKQFVQRIGFTESPLVAAFYVGNCESFYVRKTHDVGLMLADAEKLRTEWATNHRVGGAPAAVGGFTGLDYGKAGKL